jgi:hypothetical protein
MPLLKSLYVKSFDAGHKITHRGENCPQEIQDALHDAAAVHQ